VSSASRSRRRSRCPRSSPPPRELGVTEIYAIGGAQAIAALAYGTETVQRVDKIVGPGQSWTTAAKLLVSSFVGIDLPAGPSEVLIVADGSADPVLVAADLRAQAEHGPGSESILVTPDAELADAVLALVGADEQIRRGSSARSTRRSTSRTSTRRSTSS